MAVATNRRLAVLAAAVGIGVVPLAVAACSGGDAGAGEATTTTMATGGIEIAAPDGWTAIPLPLFGFGLAVPPGWEATRLDEEGLSSTGQAEPVVPGFLAAAHNAARSGAVLYAAGVDAEGRVTDLKVRAILDTNITDTAGLEALAGELAADAGVTSPAVEVVADATQPTVEVRFSARGQRAAADDPNATVDVAVEGTERLVLSPRGSVYSLIVTSEDASIHDDLATQIFATLAFPPGS